MTRNANSVGFWRSVFPNQLGNLCFIVFLIWAVMFGLYAFCDLNVFDPDDFKSTDARIPDLGTRRVVDEAGVLTQEEIESLTRQIDAYENASGGQMAVLLIRSLHGDVLEEFSLATAEKWQLGWKGEDNGVLLLLVIDDHRNRLEIGDGLEGVIPDARAGRILRGMTPFLKQARYAQAVSYAVQSVAAFVLNETEPEAPAETDDDEIVASSVPDGPFGVLSFVTIVCILGIFIGTITARIMIHPDVKKSIGLIIMIFLGRLLLEAMIAALRGGGRGGRSGGGRSGGGGGHFSGGGASGRW